MPTLQRLWDGLNSLEFYQSFGQFTQALATLTGIFINLDAKMIRYSGNDKSLHIVKSVQKLLRNNS